MLLLILIETRRIHILIFLSYLRSRIREWVWRHKSSLRLIILRIGISCLQSWEYIVIGLDKFIAIDLVHTLEFTICITITLITTYVLLEGRLILYLWLVEIILKLTLLQKELWRVLRSGNGVLANVFCIISQLT